MLDGRVLEASQVEYKPFGKPPLQRETRRRRKRRQLGRLLFKAQVKAASTAADAAVVARRTPVTTCSRCLLKRHENWKRRGPSGGAQKGQSPRAPGERAAHFDFVQRAPKPGQFALRKVPRRRNPLC